MEYINCHICNDKNFYIGEFKHKSFIGEKCDACSVTQKQGNEIIQKFMNMEIIYKYHESWNLLMTVVEKIENLDRLAGAVLIVQNCCIIKSNMAGDATVMAQEIGNYSEQNTKLSNTYKAIIKFIRWHNKITRKNNDNS